MIGASPGPDPLLDLFAACVVRIDVGGAFAGTGFYVAPGEVLTCAHVVHGGKPITVDGQPAHPITALLAADDPQARKFYRQPDAVLLGVPEGEREPHLVCVEVRELVRVHVVLGQDDAHVDTVVPGVGGRARKRWWASSVATVSLIGA